MEVNQRIRELVKALKLNRNQFSKAIGHKSPAKIYNIFNNDTKATTDILEDIIKNFAQVNGDWILTGRGEMFKDSYSLQENENIVDDQSFDFKKPETLEEFSSLLKILITNYERDKDHLRKNENRLFDLIEFLKRQIEEK